MVQFVLIALVAVTCGEKRFGCAFCRGASAPAWCGNIMNPRPEPAWRSV